ncbi:3-oxo-5-alpha-steroid 4-dehydrogenase-like protein [Dendryphion nanum]|uniref:Polyprenal reductase n=1 Tax=Dendryphion nanum TaxID=256645 RepID=A0A9P9IW04_9PLEO|nr:3-oxo-5-alpha-steroid 4-dehydrogenase-like protein [Dendryphion nanum]
MDSPGFWRLLDPVLLLRTFYLAASALILVIQVLPALRTRFLAYGSRATLISESNSASEPSQPVALSSRLLDFVASITVPHNYFTHFYVVSVLSSVFWIWLLWLSDRESIQPSWNLAGAEAATVGLAQLLMLLQGTRRLFESYTYTSSSKSEMWFGHWILGLVYYLVTNIAVWIEGAAAFQGRISGTWHQSEDVTSPAQATIGWKWAILIPAILTAHILQHSYHSYLYRLRTEHTTYQLPSHPLFPNLLCPHYTCEVAIYLLLSLLAAPAGHAVNWTLLSSAMFVLVNLGVTASGTKVWYLEKFGAEKVRGRARMVPWVW